MTRPGVLEQLRGRLATLPAGLRQSDCDGRADPLADADAGTLWHACDARQQESISLRFALDQADDIRDALLGAQDRNGADETSRAASVGRALWHAWIDYRDRALDDLHGRGHLKLT